MWWNLFKNSNELFSWFDENYEKTDDDKDIIKLIYVYKNFKNSDIYINFSKKLEQPSLIFLQHNNFYLAHFHFISIKLLL